MEKRKKQSQIDRSKDLFISNNSGTKHFKKYLPTFREYCDA